MRVCAEMLSAVLLSSAFLCGCGSGSTIFTCAIDCGGGVTVSQPPDITAVPAQNGAQIVTLSSIAPGTTFLYSLDGSIPDQHSSTTFTYQAPFLVASNLTVMAVAISPGDAASATTTKAFAPNIASGTLVWSDEFANTGTANAQPNTAVWTYDVGTNCCGNNELETYCAWASTTGPCNPANPNAYMGTDGYLHIVAEQPTAGTAVYTSARLKTQGLFSFQYGRIEARMMLPESQGMWPAFWLLGSNITTNPWPACGELDVMEHIGGSNTPFGGPGTGPAPGYDWIAGSVHGGTSSAAEKSLGTNYPSSASNGFSAAAWHTYGMIWSKGQVQYYVDSPTNIYATDTTSNFPGAWPFDQGPQFILLNLAVGGSWPGSPDATTVFPSQMVVDYVKIYTN